MKYSDLTYGKHNPDYSMTTFTVSPNKCNHDTGWFHTIHFWIFHKRIFVCEKCFTVLEEK
jgi:hypothetical protein